MSLILLAVLLLPTVALIEKKKFQYKFQNTSLPVKDRVVDIVSKMTLEEKVSQMLDEAPAIDRLGVPAYNWWNECLHGVARTAFKVTVYLQAIACRQHLIKYPYIK